MNARNTFAVTAARTAARTVPVAEPRRTVSVALGTAQVALVVVFGLAGLLKLAMPNDALARAMALPGGFVQFIGFAELAAAVALEPAMSRVTPKLTVLAATGLTVVMAFAALYHLTRGEVAMIPNNMMLGALAAFVAWGRAKELHTV